jgi:hypothetical protein
MLFIMLFLNLFTILNNNAKWGSYGFFRKKLKFRIICLTPLLAGKIIVHGQDVVLTDKKIVRGQRLSAKPTSVVHGQRGRVRCPQKLQDPDLDQKFFYFF